MIPSVDREREFYTLFWPEEYLAHVDCKVNHAYWVSSRSIGRVAICQGYTDDGLMFTGLEEYSGNFDIVPEAHRDSVSEKTRYSLGTLAPVMDLGEVPAFTNQDELKTWLLDQEIDMKETFVEWLRGMPEDYKAMRGFDEEMAQGLGDLEKLYAIQKRGWEYQRPWTLANPNPRPLTVAKSD